MTIDRSEAEKALYPTLVYAPHYDPAEHKCGWTCEAAPRTCPKGPRAERCKQCDRWMWTQADLEDHKTIHGSHLCPLEPACTFRDWLCWDVGGEACRSRAVDWRARALKVEEDVRELTRRLGEPARFVVPPVVGSLEDVVRRLGVVEEAQTDLARFINEGLAARVLALECSEPLALKERLRILEEQVATVVAKSEGRL